MCGSVRNKLGPASKPLSILHCSRKDLERIHPGDGGEHRIGHIVAWSGSDHATRTPASAAEDLGRERDRRNLRQVRGQQEGQQ